MYFPEHTVWQAVYSLIVLMCLRIHSLTHSLTPSVLHAYLVVANSNLLGGVFM